jgi:hypothetical protein
MSSWCFSNKDSATMARTPPGRTSLAMVANRWMASMSRCIIDTDASTMRVSHKTARADPFMRGFADSPWTGFVLPEYAIKALYFSLAAAALVFVGMLLLTSLHP